MKHAFFFLIAIIATLSTQICHAGPIDSNQALRNAQAFLQKKGITIQVKGIRRAPSANANQDQAPYYVFNVGDEGGFVIASGDDRAYPVLAYSDIGSFHTDSLPENVQYMLDFYKAQIKALKETETTVAKPRRSPVKVVEPMLTTKWGQGYPYNLSCPTNEKGRRCITGCVATAMAQVMYYHRKHSTRQVIKDIPGYTDYNDNDGSMTVDTVPKGSVIDWEKMEEFECTDNYTEEQAKAVANLMFYCGVAEQMSYGTMESFSPGPSPYSFVDYFDYDDDARLEQREYYTDAEWESMVYEELAKGNPIPYAGGGHAYVIDGCDADGYVHVNWGWDGEEDGYFLLSSSGYDSELDGYSEYQHAVFGARPNGSFPHLTTQNIALNGSATVEGLSSMTTFAVSFTMTVANLTDTQNSFEQAIALYKNGKQKSVVGTTINISNLAANGSKTISVTLDLDATLANGVYQLVPLSRASGTDKWRKNFNYDLFLTLTINNDKARIVVGIPQVEGDIITFADAETKRLCVENWDINGDGELSRQEAAKVTSLNGAFRYKRYIGSFDEFQYFTGLTKIDKMAFYDSGLTSIIIPPNVVSIGDSAFNDTALRSFTIPASVREIGSKALTNNGHLEDIIVETGNTCYDSRDNCHALIETATNTLLTGCKNTIILDGIKAIGENAFAGCYNLAAISIPKSVVFIGASAFSGCSKLQSVNIPEKITSIAPSAFSNCSKLQSVYIPEKVTSIGASAFSRCSNLLSINIPRGVEEIGDYAFGQCSSLTSVTLPKTIRTLAGSAFAYCENLTSIRVDAGNPYYDSRDNCNAVMEKTTNKLVLGCSNTIIPQSTKSIGDSAFYGCYLKRTLVIPSKVTSIGNHAFCVCKNIEKIELPEGLKTIGNHAFSSINKLKTMIFPSTLTSIGDYAFKDCDNIRSIELPEGLKSIGEDSFYSIDELTTVILPSTLTSIGKYAFCACRNLASVEARMETPVNIENYTFSSRDIATLYVPQGCISNYRTANYWKYFNNIVEGPIPYRDIIDFVDNDVRKICIERWDKNGDRELTKEEAAAVTDLGDAFEQNSPLSIAEGLAEENLYHPQYFNELQYFTGLTSIGKDAFYYSDSLKSVTLPPNVKIIENDAFYMCEKLQSINIPESVKTIYPAFQGCSNLKSIVIPQGVTYISGAFYGCGLTTVVVKRTDPLPIDKWTFSNYADATLYVPKGCRSAYMEAETWKLFGNIVEISDVKGDINNDGMASVADVTMLVDYILGNQNSQILLESGDVNGDGIVSVSDVTTLVNIILGKN